LPALLRVALIGGSDMLRGARRVALEENSNLKVVLESDGFALSPTDLLAYSFDVAVLDQRLPSSAAFDYVKAMQSMAKVNSSDIGRILISATFQDVDQLTVSLWIKALRHLSVQ
jgi:DNA-binding NarL/FixJ family response regulator